MKRVLLFLLVLLAVAGFAFSADLMSYPPPLDGGNILVDLGVGLVLPPKDYASIIIPPIVLSAEYCLPSRVPISVGGLVGFYQFEWDYSKTSGTQVSWVETLNFITFGARANWHWNVGVYWLDLYTGAFFGYTLFSWSYDRSPYSGYIQKLHNDFAYGGQAGAHFYFSNHIGAVVELGYPFIAKAGLALKF